MWHLAFFKAFSSIMLYSVFYKAVGLAYYAILRRNGDRKVSSISEKANIRMLVFACWTSRLSRSGFFFFKLGITRIKSNICIMLYSWADRKGRIILVL